MDYLGFVNRVEYRWWHQHGLPRVITALVLQNPAGLGSAFHEDVWVNVQQVVDARSLHVFNDLVTSL